MKRRVGLIHDGYRFHASQEQPSLPGLPFEARRRFRLPMPGE